MTVCIAAISKKTVIIGITDKLITAGNPVSTYETVDGEKVQQLTDKTMVMFAGDVVHATEIIKLAKTKVTSGSTVFDAATSLRNAFEEYWNLLLSNYLMTRFRIDLETFMKNQNAFDADLVKSVNGIAMQFNIDVEFIIAGVDDTAYIYHLDNETTIKEHTSLGYLSIGSGKQHAISSMIESEYNSDGSKPEAIMALLQAKKRAEYDPGVGKNCDIAVIETSFKKLSPKSIESIDKMYEDMRAVIAAEKSKNITAISQIKGL